MIFARFFFTRLNDKSYKRTGPVVTHSTSQNLENPPVFANGRAVHQLVVKLPVRKAFGWAYVPNSPQANQDSMLCQRVLGRHDRQDICGLGVEMAETHEAFRGLASN
jgi:hypothetical protein